mgnify:CR=1 FL=1
MKLINCEICGNLFNSEKGQVVCPACEMEENKELKKVSDFLAKNPLASLMDVVGKTGIQQAKLFKFIKNGAIKVTKAPAGLKCSVCGRTIKRGFVCHECSKKINNIKKTK